MVFTHSLSLHTFLVSFHSWSSLPERKLSIVAPCASSLLICYCTQVIVMKLPVICTRWVMLMCVCGAFVTHTHCDCVYLTHTHISTAFVSHTQASSAHTHTSTQVVEGRDGLPPPKGQERLMVLCMLADALMQVNRGGFVCMNRGGYM